MYLNCHSYYSLRFGAFSEVDLLQLAQEHGVSSLALTDINNTSACMSFVEKASHLGIHPVIGIDFRNGITQQFVGLAQNNKGFQELNSYLSAHLHSNTEFVDQAPDFENAFVIYPFEKVLLDGKTKFKSHEFIGVSVEELKKLPFTLYQSYTDKLVIQQQVTVRHKSDYNAHRLLRAIANNTLLSKLQTSEQCSVNDQMLPVEELFKVYEAFPYMIANTKAVLKACNIHFGFGESRQSQNQQFYLDSAAADYQMLEQLCETHLPKRYKNPSEKVKKRIATELNSIKTLDFVSYFLINYDIISYSKRKGYVHVGRGSGANSIVAYILGITDVDPIELDLYFERFINPFRASPPDFDIDFSWRDREDITKYIFERFENVALLGTYNTFKYRGVVRELGKVFGLPKEEIDLLSSGRQLPDQMDEMSKLVLKYGKLIQGFPNHLSVHSCGILILKRSVHYYSPTYLPPKGFPTVQIDMFVAEAVGIFKFDILGQRGLAKIQEALSIIKYNRPEVAPINITAIETFKTDPKLNTLLKEGRATGVYYVESPAMRGLMQKLQTQDYLGLVAASSIIRPGVAGSGMKQAFIARHRYPEKRQEAHPILLAILPETYGIMVYQEDVLKVASQFADLTLGEADVLRRAMSGKFRSPEEFTAIEHKFITNSRSKAHPEVLIQEIWNQIKSFAGYAFAKGHSASYAVESYQSLYLKCYFPLEFMVAVLNNGGGFYSVEHYIHETRNCGGQMQLPCINTSFQETIIQGETIFLGFDFLKGLETLLVKRVLLERLTHGIFKSLDDFVDRIAIGIESLTILIRIGAFRFSKRSKKELLWEATFKLNAQPQRSSQEALFKLEHRHFKLPEFDCSTLEDAYDQMELLGFPLQGYFSLLAEEFQAHVYAKDLKMYFNTSVLLYGELVNTRYVKTVKGKLLRFCTFIDQNGFYFDTVHFERQMEAYPINGLGVYACYGRVISDFDFYSLEIIWTQKMALRPDPRADNNF